MSCSKHVHGFGLVAFWVKLLLELCVDHCKGNDPLHCV